MTTNLEKETLQYIPVSQSFKSCALFLSSFDVVIVIKDHAVMLKVTHNTDKLFLALEKLQGDT